MVRLGVMVGSGRLEATGRPGLFGEVPDELWTAVRDLVVGKILATLAVVDKGGVSSVRQDSVAVEYSGSAEDRGGLRLQAEAVLEQWSLLGVGGF